MEPQLATSRNCSVFRTQQHASFYKCQVDHLLHRSWNNSTGFPVHQRVDYKLAVLTYKTRSTSTSSYLSHHIRAREPARSLPSSTAPLLYKPFTRTHYTDHAFRCAAPTVWNSLATDITNSCSLTIFSVRHSIAVISPIHHHHWSLFSTYWCYTNKIKIIIIIIIINMTLHGNVWFK